MTDYKQNLEKDDVNSLCNIDSLEPYDSVLEFISSNEKN